MFRSIDGQRQGPHAPHSVSSSLSFTLSFSFLFNQIKHKLSALSGLKAKLEEMQTYLKNVLNGKLPVNNQVREEDM